MDKETLQDALGNVKEPLVNEADLMRSGAYKKQIRAKNRAMRRKNWRNMGLAAACICLVFTGMIQTDLWNPFSGSSKTSYDSAENIMEAAAGDDEAFDEEVFQEDDMMVTGSGSVDSSASLMRTDSKAMGIFEYGNADSSEAEVTGAGGEEGFQSYARASIQTFLSGAEDNVLYSPVNVYSMVALMASIGTGEQQNQIFKLLQVDDKDSLYSQYQTIWNQVNQADGEADSDSACQMANSLWLSNRFSYQDELLSQLSQDMKLSSYIGEMGSDDLNTMLRKWVNDYTNHMLSDQVEQLETEADQLLTMATTLYYKASWTEKFSVSSTYEDVFYGRSGDQKAEFMSGQMEVPYIDGEGYQACFLSTADGGGMWIILPDEDADVDKLLSKEDVIDLLQGKVDPKDIESKEIRLKLPKFDVSTSLNAMDGLCELGITDNMIPDENLFQLVDEEDSYEVPQNIKHAVRVKIDEEGCEAAAFSALEKAAEPMDETRMLVNRPFLMSVVNENQLTLFTGVINNME